MHRKRADSRQRQEVHTVKHFRRRGAFPGYVISRKLAIMSELFILDTANLICTILSRLNFYVSSTAFPFSSYDFLAFIQISLNMKLWSYFYSPILIDSSEETSYFACLPEAMFC